VSDSDIQEQLTKYLTDAHSSEEQALQQLPAASGSGQAVDAALEARGVAM
jgi:hypothetical protein